MSTATLEPLAVHDVQGSWPPPNLNDFLAWAREQSIEPNDTYRIEIYLLDCLFARVFQFDKDEHGKVRCAVDHEHHPGRVMDCEVARRKPFDVPVSSMPPEASGLRKEKPWRPSS